MHALVELGNGLVQWFWSMITSVITHGGYPGIALLMAISSFNIPLPSEVVLTSAGVLVKQGGLNIHLAALASALGCVLGSLPSYAIGYYGGRPFLAKYGKWLLISEHEFETAQRWNDQYGNWTYFFCRMLPLVRAFISLPAGILRAELGMFTVLTFISSLIWSYGLLYVGVVCGRNLETFKHIWHQFDVLILGVLFVLGCLYLWKHLRHFQKASAK